MSLSIPLLPKAVIHLILEYVPERLISEAAGELQGKKVTLKNLREAKDTFAAQFLLEKLSTDALYSSFAGNFTYTPLGENQEIAVEFNLNEHIDASYKTQWQVYNSLLRMEDKEFAIHQETDNPLTRAAAILREIHLLFPKHTPQFDWDNLANNEAFSTISLQKLNKESPKHIVYGLTHYLSIYPLQKIDKIIQFIMGSKILSSNFKGELILQAQERWPKLKV